jgi:hypothetical protein
MSKKGSANVQKTTENQNSSVDTNTRNQLGGIQQAFDAAGQAGPSPLATGAAGYGTGAQQAGNLGLGALSGDSASMAKLMNPFQSQVIDANNAQWQRVNQQTSNQVSDAATRAGAFGGSRQGVATGVALGANNLAQQQQTAGLLQSGYNNAVGQAGQLAGLGFQGAGLNANLGMGGVGSPEQWQAQMMKQGFIMPTGGTSGGAQTTFGGKTEGGFHIPFFG